MSFFGSIYAEAIPHRAKSVYMYLRDRTNASGTCWPGIKKIAADLHLSRSTVNRALDDLYKAGLIEKKPRYRENGSCSSNLYVVEKALP